MCQPFLYVLYQVLKQKATFIKCMCRKMYRSYIFVRIVTDPYFCHSQGRLLCIKMPHRVYLKNDVSGEAWLFILSCYLQQHSSVGFYSEKLNICFLYCILFAFTISLLRTSVFGCGTLTILITEHSLQLALEKIIYQDLSFVNLLNIATL